MYVYIHIFMYVHTQSALEDIHVYIHIFMYVHVHTQSELEAHGWETFKLRCPGRYDMQVYTYCV